MCEIQGISCVRFRVYDSATRLPVVWQGLSTCSLARNLRRELERVRWESLGASVSMDFSVSSRKYALLSVNPVVTLG